MAAMNEAEELLLIEEADAWFEYLEATRSQSEVRYQEVEPWAWARLSQRLRATLQLRLWHGFFTHIRSARSARTRVTPARAHEKEISFAAVLPAQEAPERCARTGRSPA
jgi:hypothetical protein